MYWSLVRLSLSLRQERKNLPWKRSAAELFNENLTAILNSSDVCALAGVMFAPVFLLFHWRREKHSSAIQKRISSPIWTVALRALMFKMTPVFGRSCWCFRRRLTDRWIVIGRTVRLLTRWFSVSLLTVWTVVNVNIWSIIFIHPNTAGTRDVAR